MDFPTPEQRWDEKLGTLLRFYCQNNDSSTTKWNSQDSKLQSFQQECTELMKRDYDLIVIPNSNGQYCSTYPLDLVILLSEKSAESTNTNPMKDQNRLEELFKVARFSRVRTRFPIPVILFNGKNVCRSSTLSQKFETVFRTATNTITERSFYSNSNNLKGSKEEEDVRSRMERVRSADIELIRALNVSHICDLMVENVCKKYGFTVCSSEKNDSHKRYAQFQISAIPYPGVEFFRDFDHKNPSSASKLCFNWSTISNPAALQVNYHLSSLLCDWSLYHSWDIVTLTQNYVKLLLYILCDPTTQGLLIHCISGWDRTPMFISLLRLSLWADGVAHRSLSAQEILYLTIAYDWMLFRHQLVDRQSRGEDIFCFCFHVLSSLVSREFSVHFIRKAFEKYTPPHSISNSLSMSNYCDVQSGIGSHSLPRTAPKTIPQRRLASPNESEISLSSNGVKITPVIPIPSTSPQSILFSERVTLPEEGGTFGSWQLMTSQLDKAFSTTNTNTLDNTLSNNIKQSPIHQNEHYQQHRTSHSTIFRVEPSPQTQLYNHHVWATDDSNILCFDDIPEFSFDHSHDLIKTNQSSKSVSLESPGDSNGNSPSPVSTTSATKCELVPQNKTSMSTEQNEVWEEERRRRLEEVRREFGRLHTQWIAPEREKFTKNTSFWSHWFR